MENKQFCSGVKFAYLDFQIRKSQWWQQASWIEYRWRYPVWQGPSAGRLGEKFLRGSFTNPGEKGKHLSWNSENGHLASNLGEQADAINQRKKEIEDFRLGDPYVFSCEHVEPVISMRLSCRCAQ